jgi:hypothetical protein
MWFGLGPIIQAKDAFDDLINLAGYMQVPGTPAKVLSIVLIMVQLGGECRRHMTDSSRQYHLARRAIDLGHIQMMLVSKLLDFGHILRGRAVPRNVLRSAQLLARLLGIGIKASAQFARGGIAQINTDFNALVRVNWLDPTRVSG